jgi:hypothetical protein
VRVAEGRITKGGFDWCVKGGGCEGKRNGSMNSGLWGGRLSSENKEKDERKKGKR